MSMAADDFVTSSDLSRHPTAASRLFRALLKHDPAAEVLRLAMPDVFPWVRHLTDQEVREFTVELAQVLSDAVELDADLALEETVAGWRATARIKADPAGCRAAQAPTSGDCGPVDVVG